MKNWKEQASRNKLTIIEDENCQLCGSETENGLAECVEKSGYITHRLEHAEALNHMTIFMCVDAHALQHSEIHGRWNNHFHLSRLNLILRDKIRWHYDYSVILSNIIDSYKKENMNEIIISPKIKERGKITITDVEKAGSKSEYLELVELWAEKVFSSYNHWHDISREISFLFKNKIS